MKNQDLKEDLKQEIETEAATLERRVNSKKELASLTMPEDSYQQLMKHIQKKEQGKIKSKDSSKKENILFSRNAMATIAMVVVLITVAGLGVNGARVYVLNVEKKEENGTLDISTNTENVFYVELTEKDAYEKIEEDIGILALRLGEKPQGMELGDVFIDKEMGEAMMEFNYNNHILRIYQNKQREDASFKTQIDGTILDTVEIFHLGKNLDITEVDKGNGEIFYAIQLEYANAYYHITSDMDLESFKNILYGIIFKNG